MDRVFNEWFLEYMVPRSKGELLVMTVMDSFEASDDVLLVRRESPFMAKLYAYSKQYAPEPRNVFRRFWRMMRDPRVRIVEENEIPELPDEVRRACPEEDLYLVELAAVGLAKEIVTTDRDFRNRIDGVGGFHVVLLDDFRL